MFEGLLSVFKKRHQADSVAKYAQLYCAVNDSSIAIKDGEVTAQLVASYKYNSIQKESNRNAEAAHRANLRFLLSTFLLLALIAITILLVHHYNRQRKLQRAKYMATIAERTKLRNELDSLNTKDYDGIIARKEKEIEKKGLKK
jgi:cell division protein FtsB